MCLVTSLFFFFFFGNWQSLLRKYHISQSYSSLTRTSTLPTTEYPATQTHRIISLNLALTLPCPECHPILKRKEGWRGEGPCLRLYRRHLAQHLAPSSTVGPLHRLSFETQLQGQEIEELGDQHALPIRLHFTIEETGPERPAHPALTTQRISC